VDESVRKDSLKNDKIIIRVGGGRRRGGNNLICPPPTISLGSKKMLIIFNECNGLVPRIL
jgi:hypothetical protein